MDADQNRPWKYRRRGLIPTPMECVMLLVIICVLGFLMVTASGAPRELVRRSSCLKNLKELGMAIQLYTQDYAGKLPCDALATTTGSIGLLPAKYPRQRTSAGPRTLYATLVCPEDETAIFNRIIPGSTNKPLTSKNLSYAYSGFALNESSSPDTPVACDRSSTATWTKPRPWEKNKWTHGSKGGNVLYADGHVAFGRSNVGPMDAMKNP